MNDDQAKSVEQACECPIVPDARRHVLYPDRYVWYVLVSSLDLIMTNTVLNYLGFYEVNTIAQKAIEWMGFWGLIGFKFATVILVVLICEWVGCRRRELGRKLATWAVVISAFPVVAALAQVAWLVVS